MSERDLVPIEDAMIGSLICTCGQCGGQITFEFEALDLETGRVDIAHDFIECEECGALCDAQAADFHVSLGDHLGA